MFARRGFDSVTLADIAAATGVTPAALYRHVAGKDELVAAAIRASAAMFQAAAAGGPVALADVAARQRDHAIVYLRAAACPPPGAGETDLSLSAWISAVRAARPGLTEAAASFLVSAALGALAGPVAYGRVTLGHAVRGRLARVMSAVTDTDLPEPATPAPGPAGLAGQPEPAQPAWSRREATLSAAAALFRRHGYAGTGVDQIGATAGITGSGIYRHFGSKQDLLVTAFRRTGDRFTAAAVRAAASGGAGPEALSRVVAAYVEIACADVDLLVVYTREARNLPAAVRREMSGLQHDLYRAWEHALHRKHHGLADADARLAVQAAIGVINAAVIARPADPDWASAAGRQAIRTAASG